jgi:GNAT superfamily N-acetyltransferase
MEIRKAKVTDAPQIWGLIHELAVYEKAGNEMTLSVDQLAADGFGQNPLYTCFVAEVQQEIQGIALVYFKYSTWKGKSLYLEDIVVKEANRKMGIGEKLFKAVVAYALQENCARIDWQVLDWNAPAINFYQKWGAHIDDAWLNGRLFPQDMRRIVKG